MSLPDVRNVLRVHGRLVLNPTNLAVAFPYGGTALGLVRDAEFSPNLLVKNIETEEFGGHVTEVVACREGAIFACVLRGADLNMIQTVFIGGSAGTGTNPKISGGLGSGGNKLSGRAVKILFAPTDEARNPFLLLPSAIPHTAESARLQFTVKAEMGTAVVFVCLQSGGVAYKLAFKSDMVL